MGERRRRRDKQRQRQKESIIVQTKTFKGYKFQKIRSILLYYMQYQVVNQLQWFSIY